MDKGDGAGAASMPAAGVAGGAVVGRPYGRVQAVTTRRKLFGKEAQQIFFEHLAATCNVAWSARAAGVTAQCVYARRMKDAAFREGWERALEQGYARLEARLLAEAAGAEPIEIAGDLILPEAPFDRDLALHLLREHKKGLGGTATRPRGSPREAEWEEVENYFIRRLKALKVRLEADSPLHHPPSADGHEQGGGAPHCPALSGGQGAPAHSRLGEDQE